MNTLTERALEVLISRMNRATANAERAIDEAMEFAEASNRRIARRLPEQFIRMPMLQLLYWLINTQSMLSVEFDVELGGDATKIVSPVRLSEAVGELCRVHGDDPTAADIATL